GGVVEPAFADDDMARRHQWREALGGVQIDLQGLEVAVVDADQRGLETERAVELGAVVHLDQYVKSELAGGVHQLARQAVFEGGHDQEDAVGAERPALDHLIGVEDEILAQYREAASGARGLQMIVAALEIGRVREYREAGGAARLIGLRQRGRIEIGADQAAAGRGLLDLGNEPMAALYHLPFERRRERPHRRRRAERCPQGQLWPQGF